MGNYGSLTTFISTTQNTIGPFIQILMTSTTCPLNKVVDSVASLLENEEDTTTDFSTPEK